MRALSSTTMVVPTYSTDSSPTDQALPVTTRPWYVNVLSTGSIRMVSSFTYLIWQPVVAG